MDLKLELVMLPVSDVDRAKAFYADQVGFDADHDQVVNPELRFVQLTPPDRPARSRSARGSSRASPGSVRASRWCVDDVAAVRTELVGRGVDVTEVEHLPWGSFVHFSDPDGNSWALQQLPDRG